MKLSKIAVLEREPMNHKSILIFLIIGLNFVCVLCSGTTEWNQHLGNPGKTAYTVCTGPESPEILWNLNTSGSFDTPPFIVDDKVVILWKDSLYHTFDVKVIILDVLTGEVLQEIYSPLLSEVFPVDEKIMGKSGRNIYKIDLTAEEVLPCAIIPEKSNHNKKTNTLNNSNDFTFFFSARNDYPVVLENKIIFPTDPAVCISNSNCEIIWNLEDTIARPFSPYNACGDENIIVFLAKSETPQLIAVNPSTGTLKWMSDPLGLARCLALKDDTVYCGGKSIWAFNTEGSTLWEFNPEEEIVSNIVVSTDAVYACDAGHNLYKLALDGHLIWRTVWEGSPYFQVHLIGTKDILYCVGTIPDEVMNAAESEIAAYTMEDGSTLWSLHFEKMSGVRASPAIANNILVIGNTGGDITAFASDPALFIKQGDLFLSDGYTDKAINSYKKAAEIYEQKGNVSQYEEIQEKISELESPVESSPSETTPPKTTPPQPSIPISFFVLIITGILSGIFIVYFLIKQKE